MTSQLERLEHRKCFNGWYDVYRHSSTVCQSTMTFAVYLPEVAEKRPVPWLLWLSGLTCTHENFMVKAGAQRMANELGIALVAPDTSPRGTGIPGEGASMELGEGAGFYVNATQDPWRKHYQMFDYVNRELPSLVIANFPVVAEKCGVFGHSMGGHGALISYFRQVHPWKTCSAFAPISKPPLSPWGRRALTEYLGADESAWSQYDASELIGKAAIKQEVLVDQGMSDPFLAERLRLDELVKAAEAARYPLEVRRREGYDHSYFYVSTFVDEHLQFHARRLVE
jgi:S-formylglutathione hydrolase